MCCEICIALLARAREEAENGPAALTPKALSQRGVGRPKVDLILDLLLVVVVAMTTFGATALIAMGAVERVEETWCAPEIPADVARVLVESASLAGDAEEWNMGFQIPGGRSKGTPIEEADANDLKFWIGRRKEELEKDPNGQYAQSNRNWVMAAEKVLTDRSGGGGMPRGQSAAMVPANQGQAAMAHANQPAADVMTVQGTFVEPNAAQRSLSAAARMGHLISPATGISVMPPGCALAITVVWITEQDAYDQKGGKSMRSLSKAALMKLAAAAGISWEVGPHLGRVDDRANPHYCEWRALGYYRAFDGTVMQLPGNKTMDLRDGSAMAESLSAGELGMQRKHIEGHAETKAMLRAVRAIGLRHAYSREELARPFIVARLMFVGHSEDPAERRMFSEKIADSFLGARTALYGPAPVAVPALAAPAPVYAPRIAAPPLRRELDDDDVVPADPGQYDPGYHGEYEPEPQPQHAAPRQEPVPTARPTPASNQDAPPAPPPRRREQRRQAPAEPPANAGDAWVPPDGGATPFDDSPPM